jgi:hypothetical protein
LEYTQSLADELNYDELLILSIVVWHVNASLLPPGPTHAWSEGDREQLSQCLSPNMIDANAAIFNDRYNAIVGAQLQERDFKRKVKALIESLDYSLIAFF